MLMLDFRCTYNTTGHATATRIGMTGGDEMCNLYLMFYTLSPKVLHPTVTVKTVKGLP